MFVEGRGVKSHANMKYLSKHFSQIGANRNQITVVFFLGYLRTVALKDA